MFPPARCIILTESDISYIFLDLFRYLSYFSLGRFLYDTFLCLRSEFMKQESFVVLILFFEASVFQRSRSIHLFQALHFQNPLCNKNCLTLSITQGLTPKTIYKWKKCVFTTIELRVHLSDSKRPRACVKNTAPHGLHASAKLHGAPPPYLSQKSVCTVKK